MFDGFQERDNPEWGVSGDDIREAALSQQDPLCTSDFVPEVLFSWLFLAAIPERAIAPIPSGLISEGQWGTVVKHKRPGLESWHCHFLVA